MQRTLQEKTSGRRLEAPGEYSTLNVRILMQVSTSFVLVAVTAGLVATTSYTDANSSSKFQKAFYLTTQHALGFKSDGLDCVGAPLGPGAFVGGHDGNIARGDDSAVLGGQGNHACGLYSSISGGITNVVGPYDGNTGNDFIGSGYENLITESSYSSIDSGAGNSIRGGRASGIDSGETNTVSGIDSFIGGGNGNSVLNALSFVGGGYENNIYTLQGAIGGGQNNSVSAGTAGGADGAAYSVIAGGWSNSIVSLIASGAKYGVVSGGFRNTLTAFNGVIGGGSGNVARGDYSVVPGGYQNSALGVATFAGGTGSQAVHDGTFLWSDHAAWAAPLKSYGINEFLVRASGGVALFSSASLKSGVKLAPGSGTWSSLSDRASKTHIVALDDAAVLAKLEALPVSRWSYRTQDGSIRHVGPMSQDFYAAFGVGEDDRHITSIDEDGVALAAIKGLAAKVNHKDSEMANLKAQDKGKDLEIARLTSEAAAIKTEVAKLATRDAKLETEVKILLSRAR